MTSGADAWLVDDRWGKAYPLTDVDTTIGRGAPSSVIIRDPAVSRAHAAVKRRGASYVLEVSGASGATVNGERVGAEHILLEGDCIEIASTSLRFTMRAPTGEMFIVSRDHPVERDFQEGPTRPTLHSLHPITLFARSRGLYGQSWGRLRAYWHFILVILLTLAVLSLCASP